jgi:dTDP-4-amino-4,6-dideoxygalactose transaminase
MNKDTVSSLAVGGGAKAFDRILHVGRPTIGNRQRFLDRVNQALDRRWLSNAGPFVTEFESAVEQKLGVRHCVAMCNGTVALEIAIRALGLQGEVIVPSFTFIATAHALQWQDITPVFCDIDPRTHNIAPAQVERMITPRTSGIIGVHLWGRPCDVEGLEAIARESGLALLFDAAHAFGCSWRQRMIGSFGRAEVFSFHATKFLNTCEGGAIVTNDSELAGRCRLMRNFGFEGYDRVTHIGTNGKMNELSAAMGLTLLEDFAAIVERNRQSYRCYETGLDGLPGLSLVGYNPAETQNFQYIVVEIDEAAAGISRDDLLTVLLCENVLARRYFYPGCHRMEPYKSFFPDAGLRLPETERMAGRVLVLPGGDAVTLEEIALLCRVVRTCIEQASELRAVLARSGEAIREMRCDVRPPHTPAEQVYADR